METRMLLARIERLESNLRWTRRLAGATGGAVLLLLAGGQASAPVAGESTRPAGDLVVRSLTIVDHADRPRIVLREDSADGQRRSRAAGLTIYDAKGDERGGFGTMEDGSVVLALDAPAGVGAAMRDRLGLRVYPNGAAEVMVIDNQTRGVAKLASDADGNGGVQLFKWDMAGEDRKLHVKTITFDGPEVATYELD